jgi:hypothetical protein
MPLKMEPNIQSLAKQRQVQFPHLADSLDYLYCNVEFVLVYFPSWGMASDSTVFKRFTFYGFGYYSVYVGIGFFYISLVHLEGRDCCLTCFLSLERFRL